MSAPRGRAACCPAGAWRPQVACSRRPTALPVIGAVACAYLASPFSGRASADDRIAAVLTVIGVGLWAVTWAVRRYVLHEDVEPDPARLEAPTR